MNIVKHPSKHELQVRLKHENLVFSHVNVTNDTTENNRFAENMKIYWPFQSTINSDTKATSPLKTCKYSDDDKNSSVWEHANLMLIPVSVAIALIVLACKNNYWYFEYNIRTNQIRLRCRSYLKQIEEWALLETFYVGLRTT